MENYFLFTRPFVSAFSETISTMGGIQILSTKHSLKKQSSNLGDISAIIGINGLRNDKTIKGSMLISWKEENYLRMASRILMEEYKEFNSEIADTGAEICNIVMGNAKRDLNELGYKIEMATPNTVQGKNHSIQHPPNVSIIEIRFETDIGMIQMELSYQEI